MRSVEGCNLKNMQVVKKVGNFDKSLKRNLVQGQSQMKVYNILCGLLLLNVYEIWTLK
jgi:hypothetical protein